MAIIHQATLRPTKLELLADWLPRRSWFEGPAAALERVGAYRFDDPAGEVGVETFLVRAGDGPVAQVPLTYRGAPLDGYDRWLIGTMEHSVLGRRWMYDGCGDPVYAATLAATILSGGREADEFFEVDGRRERRDATTAVRGSGPPPGGPADAPAGPPVRVDDGDPTVIVTDPLHLVVRRLLTGGTGGAGSAAADGWPVLTGTWPGQPTPVPLAYAAPRAAGG